MLALVLAKEPAAKAAPVPLGCTLTCERPELCAQLQKILDKKPLARASVSFVAQHMHSERPLAACNPQMPLNPASNAKLWTTATALAKLGPAHRYSTRLYYQNNQFQDGVLRGDLYVRTDLDPALVTGQVFEMAQTLYARGLREITGGIVFDLEPKRRRSLPPGFDQKKELVSYRTAIGGPSVNFNTFVVWVSPGTRRNAPASVAIVPPIPGVIVENKSKTSRGSSNRARVYLTSEHARPLRVRVEGKVGQNASQRSWRLPRYDPTQYTAEVIYDALDAAKVKNTRKKYRVAKVPDQAELVSRHDSRPVGELIRSVNKYSNNFMAEQILWSLGGPTDSPKDSVKAIQAFAQSIQTPGTGLSFGNGSGLYDNNRMSAQQVAHLLRYIGGNFELAPDFLASLAVMGQDGTTRRRLHQTSASGWARVKTGTLDGVSALSGYVSVLGQAPIVFSILVNGFESWEIGQVRQAQDQVVLELQRSLNAPPSPAPAPTPAASATP